MYSPAQGPELTGSGGPTLVVDRRRSLGQLTREVNALCDMVNDDTRHTTVSLWLDDTSPEDRSWPKDVSVPEVNRWERALRRLERLHAVSLAVLTGTCGGPALDVLLATDYRIAAADARVLLAVHEGRLWPGMAVHRLVNQAGIGHGRRVLLWGSEITAEKALAVGLVDEVVTDAPAAAATAALLLSRSAGRDVAVLRQLVAEAAVTGFDEALGAHLAACDRELRRRRGRGAPEDADPESGDR